MALQPPTLTGDQIGSVDLPPPPAPAPDSQRFIPTPFLTKTYQLVDDLSIDSVISWNEDGTAFVIWNPAEFARDVLPKYFKHNNFSSFVRQLNTYGFRKVMPDRWEFSNDCFRRGEQASALRYWEGQVFSSNSTPSSAAPSATLFLDQSQCNSNNDNNSGCGDGSSSSSRAHLIDYGRCCWVLLGAVSSNSSQAESMMNPIDLISGRRLLAAAVETQAMQAAIPVASEEDMNLNPRLFGFQLGSKRTRGESSGSGEPMEQDDLLQLQQPGSSRSS
ncbi:unnamed protein product [Rhodiola kirilowii]